tara:strand:- start:208 stop:588 length:381 start_codon:yes stop_codon:yes gene_type:complete
MSESERITYRDYWQQVASLADDAAETVRDYPEDEGGQNVHDVIHELVDSHQWIIYYHHNLAVMEHTDNGAALMDEMGADGLTGADSWHEVCVRFAWWAFSADVEASYWERFTEQGRPVIKMKESAQ